MTFAQDHDQIGNRAAGDRLSQTLSFGRLAVAAVLTLTAPGTPMLFMGEEWGASTPWQFFTSHPEPELGEATARGRFEEFARMGWDRSVVPDPQDPETFRRSKLDWDEASTGDHARLLTLYRALTRLRREREDLTDPDSSSLGGEVAEAHGGRVYRLRRGELLVLANLSAADARFEAVGEILLATDAATVVVDGALVLPPDAAAVVVEAREA